MKKSKISTLAVLTSGGDAPGMNAAIRSVTRFALGHGLKVFGVTKGYSGLLEGAFTPLLASSVANIIQRGGTILKTDRCPAFFKKENRKKAVNILHSRYIDGLVVIGGDGSFAGAHLLEKETGFPVIGIPGTIDNDIAGTDYTIGFDTAVNTAIEAIDRIRDTASSHDRIFLVEVMGRNSGFIATQTGIGGGAETIIVPGDHRTIQDICKTIEKGISRGKSSSIIIVAEGPKPGMSSKMARDLEKRGYSAKVCILGHTQRGGVPTATDRYYASLMGAAAVEALMKGQSAAMIGVQNGKVVLVHYAKVFGIKKQIDPKIGCLAAFLAN